MEHLYTKEMIAEWKHSDKCLQSTNKTSCICGLAALQGHVAVMGRRTFTVILQADNGGF